MFLKQIVLKILFCIIGLIISQSVFAQDVNIQTDTSTSQKKIFIVKGYIQDEAKLWTSPLHYKKNDWFIAAPVIAVSLVLFKYDESIFQNFKNYKLQHQWVKDASPWVTAFGDGKVAVPISVLLYSGGEIFKDQKLKQTGTLAMQSMAHAAIISQIIKMAASRQRPYSMNGVDHWALFPAYFNSFKKGYSGPTYNSFPSGHSITIWTLASVIALQYKNHWYIPLICYSTATLTSLSRITMEAHWPSDVLVGAALGYGIAKFVVNKRKLTRWKLLPDCWRKNVSLKIN